MLSAIKAGFFYFLIVFSIAFIFGIFRVLALTGAVGELAAVAIEAPLVLIVSWKVSAWIFSRNHESSSLAWRCVFGLSSLVFLFSAEYLLSISIFQKTTQEFFMNMLSAAGLIGLASQFLFGIIPLLHSRGLPEPPR